MKGELMPLVHFGWERFESIDSLCNNCIPFDRKHIATQPPTLNTDEIMTETHAPWHRYPARTHRQRQERDPRSPTRLFSCPSEGDPCSQRQAVENRHTMSTLKMGMSYSGFGSMQQCKNYETRWETWIILAQMTWTPSCRTPTPKCSFLNLSLA